MGFESPEKETPQPLWQPVPVLSHPQSEVFHHIQMERQFSVKQSPSNKKISKNYFQQEFRNNTSLTPAFPTLAEDSFVRATTPFLLIQKPFLNPLSSTSCFHFS